MFSHGSNRFSYLAITARRHTHINFQITLFPISVLPSCMARASHLQDSHPRAKDAESRK